MTLRDPHHPDARVDGWIETARCRGHLRHWFSARAYSAGGSGLRVPFCERGCGAPNPRPLTDDEWDEYTYYVESHGGSPRTREEYEAAIKA